MTYIVLNKNHVLFFNSLIKVLFVYLSFTCISYVNYLSTFFTSDGINTGITCEIRLISNYTIFKITLTKY